MRLLRFLTKPRNDSPSFCHSEPPKEAKESHWAVEQNGIASGLRPRNDEKREKGCNDEKREISNAFRITGR